MDPADDVAGAAKASPLFAKYGTRTDAQSAREPIAARMEASATAAAAEQADGRRQGGGAGGQGGCERSRARAPQEMSTGGIGDFLNSRQGKQIQKEIVRGVFGMLKKAMR